jgi:hypothetical protein
MFTLVEEDCRQADVDFAGGGAGGCVDGCVESEQMRPPRPGWDGPTKINSELIYF